MSFDQNALDSLRIERSPEPPRSSGQGGVYKWFIAAVLLLAVVAAAYALLRDNAIEVETVTAVATSGGGSAGGAVLNASGYVVARRQATVSAKVTGKVAEVLIEEGMEVKEGQLLARLDEQTTRPQLQLAERQLDAARKNLQEVEVRLAEAERNLLRSQQLRSDKLVSEQALDAAQAEVGALKARLEALKSEVKVAESNVHVRKQDLDDLLVRAPFNGVVVSKDAQPGEMVSPISAGGGFTRTGIATVVDMDSREIEVDVNEAFINRVKAGQKAEAVLDAYPDWTIACHVINIVPTADRQKATVRVRIGFDELDPRILPDMGVKVSFLDDRAGQTETAAARPAVRVPSEAIMRDGDTRFVWRIRDDSVERVAVRTGGERNGQTEILSGIAGGDVLVGKPVEGLAEGAPVKNKAE
ncbi:efflux RND transporter periplasmic adaptor subunit [Steroidobacter sp. S1-65]|uniref:Efflux RND transporter periplasmic adaptor subunit n=1 Tax=Steroidobacter gossypii TaxID=2805490 RepID=A0ABS1X6I7_9GAMM|nr:efflux RND transporter periplasmic adaptor subunit [Steroidobacter gossypii]MBM0108839.1 efflux RND transporter periplasmic adaptor subunit [Steroidobacter gossypii]